MTNKRCNFDSLIKYLREIKICFWKSSKYEKQDSENETIQPKSEFGVKKIDLYLFLEREEAYFEGF